MSRAHEIYPLKDMLKSELARVEKDPFNSEIITRYYKVRSTQVSLAPLHYAVRRLRQLSEILNEKFEDATLQDIENLHFVLCKKWKCANTRNKYRKLLKQFYQWMEEYSGAEFPPRVRWIKTERVPLVHVTQDDLISFEDAVKICNAATNPRDRALFSCQLDAGCRIGEILIVRVGEVKMTEHGAVLESDGKTGKQPIILTWATPVLKQWLEVHPFKSSPDAPLFTKFSKAKPTQFMYSGATDAFHRATRRAGIQRRVWLHLLKHVSSTEDALRGMPDSFRRYKHHWSQGSKMPAVYEHLSQEVIPRIQQESWRIMRGSTDQVEKEHEKQEAPAIEDLVLELVRILRKNPEAAKLLSRIQS